MARDKVQSKIRRGMLKIRGNSLARTGARIGDRQSEVQARTGAQIGGGQGEVQGSLVAIYLSAKTVTFLLLLRIGLRTEARPWQEARPLLVGLRIGTAPYRISTM